MAECSHCSGTGRCQDDFHSGASLFGGEDSDGREHPSFLGSLIDDCPSCGDYNPGWRPECPHCDGTGRDGDDFFPSSKRLYLGYDPSRDQSPAEDNDDTDDEYSYQSAERSHSSSSYSGGGLGNYASSSPISSEKPGSGAIWGIAIAIIVIAIAGQFALPNAHDKQADNVEWEPKSLQIDEESERQRQAWIVGFRDRLSVKGFLPVKYDEGSFNNLVGEVNIDANFLENTIGLLQKSDDKYESFSDFGLCSKAIGPITQNDALKIFDGNAVLINNPSNNKTTQYFFRGGTRLRDGKICHYGGASCTGIYACLEGNPGIYLGGVNPESDDKIIGIAKPLDEYFSLDDLSFRLTQCGTPESTYRNVEVTLSQQLSTSLASDSTIASDILGAVFSRVSNLCPIKEHRPLVDVAHPLSNIDTVVSDNLGNRILELRTRTDGSW